jgi:hypothetical protein
MRGSSSQNAGQAILLTGLGVFYSGLFWLYHFLEEVEEEVEEEAALRAASFFRKRS